MFELLMKLVQELMFLTGYVGGGITFPEQLSPEEEKMYLMKYKNGDIDARNTLIEHNLRLVAHIAKKYSNEQNADDFISIGIIGLIKGINTFNPEKSPKLSTYIARCIENEVLMVLRSSKKLTNEIPLDECIGIDKEGNSLTFADVLASDSSDIADDIALKSDIKTLYQLMQSHLTRAEADILCKRYGLLGSKRKTQQEIADVLKISRSYVSRIEKKAIKKLRDAFHQQNSSEIL